MTTLLRDARGIRLLRRTPNCGGRAHLALGIAATTAIFSVVYGTFFEPLPYRQADRLVMVWEQQRGERRSVSPGNYVEWKRRATAFSDINAWGGGPVNIATAERPERVIAGRATPGFLGMLGYGHPLALGRTFIEDEGTPGRDKVVILTYRLWQDRFGGDRSIVGRAVRIDGEPTRSSVFSARSSRSSTEQGLAATCLPRRPASRPWRPERHGSAQGWRRAR